MKYLCKICGKIIEAKNIHDIVNYHEKDLGKPKHCKRTKKKIRWAVDVKCGRKILRVGICYPCHKKKIYEKSNHKFIKLDKDDEKLMSILMGENGEEP